MLVHLCEHKDMDSVICGNAMFFPGRKHSAFSTQG